MSDIETFVAALAAGSIGALASPCAKKRSAPSSSFVVASTAGGAGVLPVRARFALGGAGVLLPAFLEAPGAFDARGGGGVADERGALDVRGAAFDAGAADVRGFGGRFVRGRSVAGAGSLASVAASSAISLGASTSVMSLRPSSEDRISPPSVLDPSGVVDVRRARIPSRILIEATAVRDPPGALFAEKRITASGSERPQDRAPDQGRATMAQGWRRV
jgi:hypothetical protein